VRSTPGSIREEKKNNWAPSWEEFKGRNESKNSKEMET
jgi:hypothetical protein